MVSYLVKLLFNKDLVLFNRHRQTEPLVLERINRKDFLFMEMSGIWSKIPFRSTDKRKFFWMFFVLNALKPRYIIDINWISPFHRLYKVWARNNPGSQFVVVQHGSYAGGVVTDVAHRYTQCDLFLTWGPYFQDLFANYNSKKGARILNFGNPVFNSLSRPTSYPPVDRLRKILIAPSGMDVERFRFFKELQDRLAAMGMEVHFKLHNGQLKKFFGPTGLSLEEGAIYSILRERKYNLVISDHSTLVLDAIFLKNRVAVYAPIIEGQQKAFWQNCFVQHLGNLFHSVNSISSEEDLQTFIDVEAQEKLLQEMISIKDNSLRSLQGMANADAE